jgi:hypothetical protein
MFNFLATPLLENPLFGKKWRKSTFWKKVAQKSLIITRKI